MKIKRMMVPTDFSDSSLRALEFAVDLAKPFEAEIVVLFVVEPVLLVVPDYAGTLSADSAELAQEQRRMGRVELARLEKRYARRGIKLRTLLQVARPSQAIVETAKKVKTDLIVMATHGRTGVSRMLMGSVTERVVRTATCPVLTLHGGAKPAARKRAARR